MTAAELQKHFMHAQRRAARHVEAIQILSTTVATLRGMGYAPCFDGEETAEDGPTLRLRLDLGTLDLGTPDPGRGPMAEIVPAPEPATQPESKTPEIKADEIEADGFVTIRGKTPSAKPVEPEPETEGVAATPDPRRPWLEAEELTALDLDAQGFNTREIGAALHRSWQAVALKLKALKEAREIEAAPVFVAVPEPEPEAAPGPDACEPPEPDAAPEPGACEPPEPDAAPEPEGVPCPDGHAVAADIFALFNAREKAVERRLSFIGYPDPFTPALDLQMAEALARGDGMNSVVSATGLDKQLLLHRWRALLPEAGIDQQKALLTVLRARARMAEA